MSNKKLNWSNDEDHFTKKSSLFKKVFQGSTEKTQKQIDDASNQTGLYIAGNMSRYYETLRDSLLQTKDSSSKSPSLIAIISSYKGEGVSTIASNLAATLAKNSDNHVLLVDVNYRDPSAHQILGATSSSARLASLLDGVIIVAESEKVRWEAIQRVKGQLVKANANILGVVLNKKQFHIPRWLYKTL